MDCHVKYTYINNKKNKLQRLTVTTCVALRPPNLLHCVNVLSEVHIMQAQPSQMDNLDIAV